jgi:MarR family transcriptional regulator, lower aerobic nicotinate degradation pathway regulator
MSLNGARDTGFESEEDYLFIQSLLEKAREFRKSGGAPNVSEFSAWLSEEFTHQEVSLPFLFPGESVESAASKYIIYLYRYAKGYGKKLLKDTPLSSIDDVPYLLMLLFSGPSTKMELIQANVHEKTTGMEILNRLLRLGLVEQHFNLDDKRSRKLSISPEGQKLMQHLMKGMDSLSAIVSGNLASNERTSLLKMLHKLNDFHHHVHQDAREKSLSEIEKEYLLSNGKS